MQREKFASSLLIFVYRTVELYIQYVIKIHRKSLFNCMYIIIYIYRYEISNGQFNDSVFVIVSLFTYIICQVKNTKLE